MTNSLTNPLTINAPEGLPFVDTEREFDAPVEAVFGAHADPALYSQWVGPHGYRMTIERHDFVTGGGFRFGHTDPDGNTFWFRGVFHTIRENELAIQTFEFEGVPDEPSLETLTFADLGEGRSRLSGHSVFGSVQARDAMVDSGMEQGMSEGYERLDALLASTADR